MDVDAKIGQLGKFGRWQLAVFFFSACIAQCFACWHMLIIVFIGADPQHHCKLGQNATLNESIPLEVRKGELQLSQCLMYDNASFSNHTTKCTDGWDYSFKYVKDSIISEWDLVCDDNYLAEISQAVFMVGVVIGAGAFAPLADTFGRKFAFILAEWCLVVSGVVVAFAPNYYVFVVARFFGGIFQQGLSIPAFIIACELFPASARTYAGVGFNLFWAFAMIVLAGVAYFIRSWSWLQLAISIPGVLTLFHYWKTPESIPWLIAQNRYKHANDVIQRAAKFNKVSVPENMFKEEMLEDEMDGGEDKQCQMIIRSCNADKQGKRKKTVSAMDVFKSPRMAGNAAIMCLIWFVNSIVYYGLTLSTGNLSDGSVYINFVLSGLVEIPANLVAMFALQRWGRRWPVAIFHFTAGVGLLLTLAVPEKTGSGLNLAPLRLTLSLIGKMGISGSFAAVWMWAPELYPTNIRNFGVGMSSVCGRIGSILAPFSVYVVKYIPWLPTSIFGGLALLVAVLGLFLPETLNRALPQTVQDVENWTRVISPEEKERNKHLSLVIPQRIRLDTYSLATSLQSIRD